MNRISSSRLAVVCPALLVLLSGPLQLTPSALAPSYGTQRHLPGRDPHAQPAAGDVVMKGAITPRLFAALTDAVSRAEPGSIRNLIVTSPGGSVDVAMGIAEAVAQRQWKLIVDGHCLSACASYLFTAAREKAVRPGGIVGIHSLSRVYGSRWDNNGEDSGNEIADRMIARRVSDKDFDAGMQLTYRIRRFFTSHGISYDLHQVYDDYLTRRKRVLGVANINDYPGTAACPRIDVWALDRAHLENMGVTGIAEFWFPATAAQQRAVSDRIGVQPGAIFFGSARQLASLCQGPPDHGAIRVWRKLAPVAMRPIQ